MILLSKSGSEAGKWKSVMFVIIAAYLFATGIWMLKTGGSVSRAITNLALGACSLIVTKYQKKVYLSPIGFVKETHTWFTHHRQVLPWKDIQHVTLMSKGERLIAFIEKDSLGSKIFFERKDIPLIKETVKQHGPKIPIRIDESQSRF